MHFGQTQLTQPLTELRHHERALWRDLRFVLEKKPGQRKFDGLGFGRPIDHRREDDAVARDGRCFSIGAEQR